MHYLPVFLDKIEHQAKDKVVKVLYRHAMSPINSNAILKIVLKSANSINDEKKSVDHPYRNELYFEEETELQHFMTKTSFMFN